ncbi:polyphosphate polymerase domain-containing protein [Leucobacter denitrificans]|uniref:Polyphosphate polymerase domain-containing protein n=1 Tax=Leucobacter denitrificans TaxID=683042 RepID=A0A7G9S235_9MICO|nr:polyphosphate polymerase domain-containing protein [Leucobacter denitrificans]QNN61910.1 polyphosphate polymerase domain-containing protein [Leucobacter denitrificans]
MIDVSFARFAPVGLDELASEAALLTRVDRKYLVPIHTALTLIDGLDSGTRVLEIDRTRRLSYDSLYFDTFDRLSFRLTAQRRRRRFKIRTRHYCDTGESFVEVKTKGGRGTTVKRRMPIDPQARGELTPEAAGFVRATLAEQGVDPAVVDRLHPALRSTYTRSTLLIRGGSRATIDTHLAWVSPSWRHDGAARTLSMTDHAIIESKSLGGPSEIDRTLWRLGHRPSGISKFGTGTAALHPELPSNKWARVLRGPFSHNAPLHPRIHS